MWTQQLLLLSEPRCLAWAKPLPRVYLQAPELGTLLPFTILLPAGIPLPHSHRHCRHHRAAVTDCTQYHPFRCKKANAEPLLPCQGFRFAYWGSSSEKLLSLKPAIFTTHLQTARCHFPLYTEHVTPCSVSVWFMWTVVYGLLAIGTENAKPMCMRPL